MKLSLKAVAMTTGIMSAGCILIVGLVNLANPQYGAGFLALIRSLYPGLNLAHRWENLLLGTVYGFVDGASGGLVFAWLYDRFVAGIHVNDHHAS